MTVKNVTKNTIISKDLKIATSFSDRLFGLLIKKNPRSLLFKARFGIHTIGLKTSIDVLVIDNRQKVVKLKTLSPNKLFFYNPKFNLVLELPHGTILKSKTKIRDNINIE